MVFLRGDRGLSVLWDDLKSGLADLYAKKRVSYSQLYQCVYSICVDKAPQQNTQTTGVFGENEADERETLYAHVKATMTEHLKSLVERGREKQEEELLRYVVDEWKDFHICYSSVKDICLYLNYCWIGPEMARGNPNVLAIDHLSVLIWSETFFDVLHDDVLRTVLMLIEKERDGKAIESHLISTVLAYYEEMGNHLHTFEEERPRIFSKFENDFLNETETYYSRKCSELLQNDSSFSEFMNKVECLLNEEKIRSENYLPKSTQTKLSDILAKTLIAPQLHLFHNEISDIIENKKYDDLGRMYRLCSQVDGGVDELEKGFEELVVKRGLSAIEAVADQAIRDPMLFVKKTASFLKNCEEILKNCFQNDGVFERALVKVAAGFLKKNAEISMSKGSKGCEEFLVRCADSLLRKSSSNSNYSKVVDPSTESPKNCYQTMSKKPTIDELELSLLDVIKVFSYIEDKDVFQKFYTRMFYKRLMTDTSVSVEAERTMINMLEDVTEFGFTTRLQEMLTDYSLSKELTKNFQSLSKNDKKLPLELDFSVKVFRANFLQSVQMIKIEIPLKMRIAEEEFSKYYLGKHTSRKLTWIHSQGRGELTSHGFEKHYTFRAWTPQMAVLLLFNEQTEYTLDTLNENLGTEKEQLVSVLGTLLKNDIVLSEKMAGGEECNSTSGDVLFRLNKKFVNKKLKVDLTKSAMFSEKNESETVHKNVVNDRMMVIEAVVVGIMKMHKTRTHAALIDEALSQLSTRFKPQIPMIKHSIDALIDKEYLKRKEHEKDTYEYIA